MSIVGGFIVPHKPHPLLAPDANPGYAELRAAYERARQRIEALKPDLLLMFSTQWRSIIGHQIQADPAPEWVHVDEEFHALGSIPYRFRMDTELAHAYEQAARARGLHCRTVSYHGFPIDTGTIVAMKLLNPDNRVPGCVVSCNMYSDRSETLVLGKAAADAIERTGRRAVVVAVTALSNRMLTEDIDLADDRISSLKDDEWNRKILELLGEGRLEDVSQLMRELERQANADSKGKAIWWLAAAMGQHNRYEGSVYAYQPLYGTGGAVVELRPAAKAARDQEFDEDDAEVFGGDRNVLDSSQAPAEEIAAPQQVHVAPQQITPVRRENTNTVMATAAPKPVGAYPHARREGELLFLSGVGPRQAGTDAIPGGPVRDAAGAPLPYDIEAQTEATIANVRAILEAAGSSLEKVVDVTAFLIDMDRDFAGYNRVYARHFSGATRTTLAVSALPTPIAVELKVIARL